MSVSQIDVESLQTLSQWTSFMEFLQNPEKYIKIVDTANKALTEANKAIGIYNTVTKANEYKEITTQEALITKTQLEKEKAQIQALRDDFEAKMKQSQEALTEANSSMTAQKIELTKKEEDFLNKAQIQNSMIQSLKDKEEILLKREIMLQEKQISLDTLMSQIKAVL